MSSRQKEHIFEGLGVSPGIGIGTVHVRESGLAEQTEYCVPHNRIEDELSRLEDALATSREQLSVLRQKAKSLPDAAAEELGYLLDAHIHMLKGSRLVRGIQDFIRDHQINAEAAIKHVVEEISEGFKALDDAYIASRESDVHQVAARLSRNLSDAPFPTLQDLEEDSIIIAEELTPADTAQMDPKTVAGFATLLGGAESHTAIMARALNIPAVLGVGELMGAVTSGDTIIIDGEQGRVIVHPTQKTLDDYRQRAQAHQEKLDGLVHLKDKKAVTQDDVAINLCANVELPLEIEQVLQNGAEGIGLLRSEFMFMNRDSLPSEDEQYEIFKTLIEAVGDHPVTIRTLDIGGDKTSPPLIEDFGNSILSPLGMRGIRLSLNRPDILETQYRAILRASVHGKVRILLPMVTSAHDVRQARRLLHSVARRMRQEGIELPKFLPALGAMIEVPGAALAADALAQVCEFFAIGSNDLTMYTLATDRADDQVAHLYDPLHPAVLRLIQFTATAGRQHDIPVSVCGEIAGNTKFTPLLIGMGIRDLSMSANKIPYVKQRILDMKEEAACQRATAVMAQTDSERISMLLNDFTD